MKIDLNWEISFFLLNPALHLNRIIPLQQLYVNSFTLTGAEGFVVFFKLYATAKPKSSLMASFCTDMQILSIIYLPRSKKHDHKTSLSLIVIFTSTRWASSTASLAWHWLQTTHCHLQPLHQTRQLSHTCETERVVKKRCKQWRS